MTVPHHPALAPSPNLAAAPIFLTERIGAPTPARKSDCRVERVRAGWGGLGESDERAPGPQLAGVVAGREHGDTREANDVDGARETAQLDLSVRHRR